MELVRQQEFKKSSQQAFELIHKTGAQIPMNPCTHQKEPGNDLRESTDGNHCNQGGQELCRKHERIRCFNG